MNLNYFYHLLLTTALVLLLCLGASAQTPSFNHFKVRSLFHGTPTGLKVRGNALAIMYKTRIQDVYKAHGLNFAGHYCLVWWGCGSDCQHAAVVDLRTGNVYDGPTAASLFEYRLNSRLLIVNRPGNINCAFCKPEYWLWNDHKKRFTYIR